MKNALMQLEDLGQSIWLDNISRALISSGELERLREQGVLGMTSNPTIFDKAISGSADYDAQLREILAAAPLAETGEIVRALMVKDIQMAADILRPVHTRTGGRDGFISLEVTPQKAHDTEATIEEVRELHERVGRPNVMVKIPATREGLPAITRAIRDGYSINVTLIFSVDRYREVANAYITGLEQRTRDGKSLAGIASVASIFVSRIDTLADELLNKKIAESKDPSATARLKALLGKVAVANTKMVYQAFKEIFGGSRFAALKARGADLQRPLWASTGTKNPAYSDLLYVDTLIGPHTVNTVPPATYAAILDHCRPALTVEDDLDGARRTLGELASAGIDIAAVTRKLEDDGVAAFEKSFDGLYQNLQEKKKSMSVGAVA